MDAPVQPSACGVAVSSAVVPGIVPLKQVIGAEVRGLDLRNPLDPDTRHLLRQAWHEHAVLVIRDQVIGRKDQARFGECFGALQMARDKNGVEQPHPWMTNVTNIRMNGTPIGHGPDGEIEFHSDMCYLEEPPVGTILYSLEVPSKGGHTLFASTNAAYDALPADMKARIDGLTALHTYDVSAYPTTRRVPPPGSPSHVHPVVRIHPVTKRKALYVNRLTTFGIEGMEAEESDALLEALFAHQEQPQFRYEHIWHVGDVVLWDNRCTIHARTDFSPVERRWLRRLVVMQEHPT